MKNTLYQGWLNAADCDPARIGNANKKFAKKLDFKNIKFPVKLELFTKSEKRIPSSLVFLVIKIWKNIQFLYRKML